MPDGSPLSDDERLRIAERGLGHTFSDRRLLRRALTHPSRAKELGEKRRGAEDYETLEFLGDSVLGLIVSEHLYRTYPDWTAGEMSKVKAPIVSGALWAEVSAGLGLDEAVLLAESAESLRTVRSTLANVFESLVGALFLEHGLDAARAFALGVLAERIAGEAEGHAGADIKGILQEATMSLDGSLPVYRTVDEQGPPHDRTFAVEVLVHGRIMGAGTGRTKKEAEKHAAEAAYEALSGELGEAPPDGL